MSPATVHCYGRIENKSDVAFYHQIRNAPQKTDPIWTFQDWNEVKPGFLEADLVAHCGTQAEGSFLYTLTLTDVATGWTECLPLLNRGQEAVVAALRRAQQLLPFPILGMSNLQWSGIY